MARSGQFSGNPTPDFSKRKSGKVNKKDIASDLFILQGDLDGEFPKGYVKALSKLASVAVVGNEDGSAFGYTIAIGIFLVLCDCTLSDIFIYLPPAINKQLITIIKTDSSTNKVNIMPDPAGTDSIKPSETNQVFLVDENQSAMLLGDGIDSVRNINLGNFSSEELVETASIPSVDNHIVTWKGTSGKIIQDIVNAFLTDDTVSVALTTNSGYQLNLQGDQETILGSNLQDTGIQVIQGDKKFYISIGGVQIGYFDSTGLIVGDGGITEAGELFQPDNTVGKILIADGVKYLAKALSLGAIITEEGVVALRDGTGLFSVAQTIFSKYIAFGDSITAGTGGSPWYVYDLMIDSGAATTNRGISGYYCSNMVSDQIFPNENPTEKNQTVYSILIGTNDANNKGLGAWEDIYKNCLGAGASWLAIPTTSKVFGQDAGNTPTGSWSNDNTYQTGIGLKSHTSGDSLSVPITTYGGPLYIWHRLVDGGGGVFEVQVDGGTPLSVDCFTSPLMGGDSVGMVRIPDIAAGSHTVLITLTSATSAGNIVSVLGVGTVPQNVHYKCPKVFVGGVLRQASDANASITSGYNDDSFDVISELNLDGLSVYFVNVRNYVNTTTDMNDALHPNTTGHSHLRDAFESIMQFNSSPVFPIPLKMYIPYPADITGYNQLNALNNVSTTALNGGIDLYHDGGNSFGMDFGFGAGGYGPRIFSTQMIAFAQSTALPTSQSDFTARLLLLCATGQMINYATTPGGCTGYFMLNALGLANTSALNPGIVLFSDGNYGMDLGYDTEYGTRIFTNSGKNIIFAKTNGGPTAQSHFTNLMKIFSSGLVQILLGNLDMVSHKIINVTDPTSAQDAATKNYVDNVASALNPAVAVQAATTSASDTSGYTYNNGVSGIGATLTGVVNTALTVDGYTFTAINQRLLVKDDTQSPSGSKNGIYYVTQIQTSLLPLILTRAIDYNQSSDINNTGAIPVVSGTVNTKTSWLLTSLVSTVGTDPLTYVQFSINPSTIVPTTRNISTTSPITGGGNLASDLTIAIPKSTNAVDGYLASADFKSFQCVASIQGNRFSNGL